jgi:hypothetical protein
LRPAVLALLALSLAVIGLTTHIARKLTYTGDEPRYMLYALSLGLEHKPVMSAEAYETLRAQSRPALKVPAYAIADLQNGSTLPQHSIMASLMFAPVAASLPLQQVRLVALLAGLIGLFFLGKVILAGSSSLFEAVACFLPATFFFPAVSYYFLALPEIFLFLLVSIAFWNLLSVEGTRVQAFWPSILASCVAPFFQLRGAALFFTVAGFLAWKLSWRRPLKNSWRPVGGLLLVYLVTGLLLLLYNQVINGSPLGSANSARPEIGLGTLTGLFLNWRHGLLVYAPIFLLSAAGVIAGLWQRQPWAWPAAIFLCLTILLSVGPDPGESFPARFWVQAVPALSLSLLGYVKGRIPTIFKVPIYLLLGIVCITNTVLFFIKPDGYLFARSGPLPYDELFEMVPWVHLGFWTNCFSAPDCRTWALAGLFVFVALCAAASIRRSTVLSTAVLAIVLIAFEVHRARPIKASIQSEANRVAIASEDSLIVRHSPLRIQLRPSWTPDPAEYLTSVSGGDTRWQRTTNSLLVLKKNNQWTVPLALDLNWNSESPSTLDPTNIRVAISTSWIVSWW